MSEKLTPTFLEEIFKLCFIKRTFLEICLEHLKFQYIPVELKSYKLILQSINSQYSITSKLPSYGVISQQFASDPDVQDTITKIKNSKIVDSELAIKQLFQFIRDVRFQMLFNEVVDKYQHDKKDEAFEMFTKGADELSNFSLRSSRGQFMRVFADFKQVMKEKQIAKEIGEDVKEKVPFGIDVLDNLTDGGIDTGDTALWIMRSGVGKSTALKFSGMYAARLGYSVLHIQLEGSKSEAFDKYSQLWTGSTYNEVKWGNISREKQIKIDRVIEDMGVKGREIEIYAFEQFGSVTMSDIRDLVVEYEKVKGKFPDLIIVDSLDLLKSGTNKKIDNDPEYKKDKLQSVAQLMKNLAVEFKTRILTATQTGDISPERYNNPDWVITRANTEGDRTLVKPFSFVFTGNQTVDENKKGIMRIFVDKFRNYSVKDAVYPICAAYEVGKFYDRNKTKKNYPYLFQE